MTEYTHMYVYILCIHSCTYIHTFELANNMLNDLSLSLSHFILGTSWDTKKVLQLQRPSTRVSVGPYGYGVYGFPWGNPLTDLSFGNGSQLHGMAAIQLDGEPMFAKKKVLRNTRSSHQMTCRPCRLWSTAYLQSYGTCQWLVPLGTDAAGESQVKSVVNSESAKVMMMMMIIESNLLYHIIYFIESNYI